VIIFACSCARSQAPASDSNDEGNDRGWAVANCQVYTAVRQVRLSRLVHCSSTSLMCGAVRRLRRQIRHARYDLIRYARADWASWERRQQMAGGKKSICEACVTTDDWISGQNARETTQQTGVLIGLWWIRIGVSAMHTPSRQEVLPAWYCRRGIGQTAIDHVSFNLPCPCIRMPAA